MNTRNERDRNEKTVANPSKRARLDVLLFNGAAPAQAFIGPKLPPMQGE
ncbi:MAG TPA: hypothetical protein VGS22_19275 [Thermoanaerobaculia bacterium]|jgi:hypothetical protein|nr:hypothetical protein [Thermoanaerobaculia bacterium]